MTVKDTKLWQDHEDDYQRLREAVAIDKYDLDTALSQQPALYLDACDLYVVATDRRDFFKERVSLQFAETSAAVRASGEYKTEAAIKEATEVSLDLRDLKARLAFWTSKVNTTFALREAIDQKGKMLKELVHLFISGYYQQSGAGATGKRLEDHEYEANRKSLAEARLSRAEKGSRSK